MPRGRTCRCRRRVSARIRRLATGICRDRRMLPSTPGAVYEPHWRRSLVMLQSAVFRITSTGLKAPSVMKSGRRLPGVLRIDARMVTFYLICFRHISPLYRYRRLQSCHGINDVNELGLKWLAQPPDIRRPGCVAAQLRSKRGVLCGLAGDDAVFAAGSGMRHWQVILSMTRSCRKACGGGDTAFKWSVRSMPIIASY